MAGNCQGEGHSSHCYINHPCCSRAFSSTADNRPTRPTDFRVSSLNNPTLVLKAKTVFSFTTRQTPLFQHLVLLRSFTVQKQNCQKLHKYPRQTSHLLLQTHKVEQD